MSQRDRHNKGPDSEKSPSSPPDLDTSVLDGFDEDALDGLDERPTAIPPDSFYDRLVRKTTSSGISVPTNNDDPEIEIIADEPEVDIPVLAGNESDPQEIPIDLDFDLDFDDSPQQSPAQNRDPSTPPSPFDERPTTPRLDLDVPGSMQHPPPPLPTGEWKEPTTAKSKPSNETLEALRGPSWRTHETRKSTDQQNSPPDWSDDEQDDLPESPELELALDHVLGDALNLVATHSGEHNLELLNEPANEEPADPRMTQLRDKFDLGDFTGAHELAEELLADDPNNEEAITIRDNCREVLVQMYTSKFGSLHEVPRVIVSPDDMRWLSLDHRAGFLLSCIDGFSTIDEIMDVSGMSNLETLRLLFQLLQQDIIEIS